MNEWIVRIFAFSFHNLYANIRFKNAKIRVDFRPCEKKQEKVLERRASILIEWTNEWMTLTN